MVISMRVLHNNNMSPDQDDNNTTGYIKRPAKSILKLRENNTVPITLADPKENRRVSFASKVQLHKIDFVPVLNDEGPHLPQEDSDSDSFDEDSSFLTLENDADKIVSALHGVHQLTDSDMSDLEPEEETMELTGQFRKAAQDVLVAVEQTPDLIGEETGNSNGHSEPQMPQMPLGDQGQQGEANEESHEQDKPLENHGDLLELREQNLETDVSQVDGQDLETLDSSQEKLEGTEGQEGEEPEGEEQEGEEPEDEVEMELTETIKTVTEEVTMEFTMVNPLSLARSAEVTDTNAQASGDYDRDTQPIEEETMDITKLADIPKTNTESEPEEHLSPIQVPTLEPIGEDDEEVAMELTQSVPTITPSVLAAQSVPETASDEELPQVSTPPNTQVNEEDMDITIPVHSKSVEANGEVETPGARSPNKSPLPDTRVPKLSSPLPDITDSGEPDATAETSGKRTLGPAIEFSANKVPRLETQITTSTIPLADVSMTSWDGDDDNWDGVNLSLTDFLKEIGVKFYDDLEIATDLTSRYRLPPNESQAAYTKEEYYRANIQLPLLEVYELSCKELAGKIQQGKMLFDELKEKTEQDNPDLFRQYLSAPFYEQMSMKSRFHLLKEFTRQQAKEVWYEWRTKLIQNILEVLQNNLEILRSDQAIIKNNSEVLEESYEDMKQELDSLKLDVLRFKEIRSKFQDLDAEQIKSIKSRLTELNQKLLDHRDLIIQNQEKMDALQAEIDKRNGDIDACNSQLALVEHKLSKTRHFNSAEIETLQLQSQALQACAGLKFVRKTHDGKFEFEFNPRMGITIDLDKADSTDGLVFHPHDSTERVLYNEYLLDNYCHRLAEQTTFVNIHETLISFRKQWAKFLEMDEEIYKISLKYPITFTPNDESVAFNFEYFSFDEDVKVQLAVTIPLKTISSFPKNVQVHAQVIRGAQMSATTLRQAFLHGQVTYRLMQGNIQLA